MFGSNKKNNNNESEDSLRQKLIETWRSSLTGDNTADPLDIVVTELAEYFKMSASEVKQRCLNWEEDSLKEWESQDRSTPQGLLEFYQTQISWIFDTMWYHAQQYHGEANAETVEIALGLQQRNIKEPGSHLDFGAGPGSSSMFFHKLGWQVSLADISTTMLNFAKWRLGQHGVTATFYDTTKEQLPTDSFDLVTAFDVMVHVPNISGTIKQLHSALKQGGYLVFNIDNRPKTRLTAWHLYEEQYPILKEIRKTGFKRHPKIKYFHVYQKVERSHLETRFIEIYDQLRYNRYINLVGNQVRKFKYKLGQTVN